MSENTSDRNLLFGVLAWQAGVLTESQLLAAMQSWTFNKGKSLGQILVEQSVLTESQREKIEPMVQAHLELHHGNVGQALQSLSSVPAVTMSLRQQISDDEVQASLNHLVQTVHFDSADRAKTPLEPNMLEPQSGESRFQIIRPHARGGLGEVYLAEDRELHREVALKEIQSPFADQPENRSRFVLEAEITGGLEHPGIVPVYGLGQYEDGRPYYAMRFIKGDSLKDAIKEFHENKSLSDSERNLQLRKLLGRFVDVCQAISYAHSRGVLHRDLKPGNIMLGKYGETLVVDWGLAKVAGRDDLLKVGDEHTLQPTSGSGVTPTVMGSAIGTPAYMPPEQAAGRLDELGPASDVYSLGATLYHLLTGKSPFAGNDLAGILKGVQDGTFTSPRVVNSDIQPAIEAVCLKAMSLKPADRYPSPEDLANDIEQFLADEPVSAMSEPFWVKASRWARKHQTLAAATAAAVLVGIVGLGLFQKHSSDLAAVDLIVQTRNAEVQKRLTETAQAERDRVEATLARSNNFLAVARWDANRAKEANELLELVPEQYRNFEWRLAKRQFRGSDLTCYGHMHRVMSVSFSPDGTHIASGSLDKTIKVWDAATGAELRTLKGHTRRVMSVSYNSNGTRIVSGSGDNTIRLWDAETGTELRTLLGHTDVIESVSFSPDGTRIASGSWDKTIKVWDAATGAELRTLQGHTGQITSVSFSPDGKWIVSAGDSRDKTIKLWDAETGAELRTLEGHTSQVSSVSFSPDGTRIASGSLDNTVKLWEAATGAELSTLLRHSDAVTSVSFSLDGTRIAVGCADRTIKLWDAVSGAELSTFQGHTDWVMSVAFSPDGTRIASGSADNTTRLWDAATGSEVRTLQGHTDEVTSLSFHPDGTRIASAGFDNTIRFWDAMTGAELRTFEVYEYEVGSVSFSPDGTRLVSFGGFEETTIRLWDPATGDVLRIFEGHTEPVTSVSFSSDGARIASASDDQTIKLWDTATGSELRTFEGHTKQVTGVSFSPDGTRIASGCEDTTIKLWDAETGAELRTLMGHTWPVTSVCFSPDGTQLASTSLGYPIRLWDVVTGTELRTLKGHTEQATSVSFSPDGTRIASGSWDQTIKLWDAATGSELRTLKGHTDLVTSVSFSPDGTRVASGGLDKTIKLWEAATGSELITLEGHTDLVTSVSVSPDGTRVASGSLDNTIKLWEAATGSELRTLEGHTDLVTSVSFSPDGTRLYSGSAKEKLIWQVATGEILADLDWKSPNFRSNVTPDGRWLAIPWNESILLVDREFKNTSSEKAYRVFKAKPKPWWHEEQAAKAEAAEAWFASTFHRAWQLKFEPDSRPAYDALHKAYEQLDDELAKLLPAVVAESLSLPAPKEAELL